MNLTEISKSKGLTKTEKEVLELLWEDKKDAEIAEIRRTTEINVRRQVSNIANKFGIEAKTKRKTDRRAQLLDLKNIYLKNDSTIEEKPQVIPSEKVVEKTLSFFRRGIPTTQGWIDRSRKKQLKRLEELVLRSNIKVIVVTGIPGVGKSAYVSHFVQKTLQDKSRFEGYLWKILESRSEGVNACELLTESLSKELLNDAVDSQGIKQINRNSLNYLLDHLIKHPTFLVLDNVENMIEESQPNLGRFIDTNYSNFFRKFSELEHCSKIVLISRVEIKDIPFGLFEEINLKEGLRESETIALLESLLAEDKEHKESLHTELLPASKLLYSATKGHPLSIRLLAGVIAHKHQPIKAFLSDLLNLGIGDSILEMSEKDIENRLSSIFGLINDGEKTILQRLSLRATQIFPVTHSQMKTMMDSMRDDLKEGIILSLRSKNLISFYTVNDQIFYEIHPFIEQEARRSLKVNEEKYREESSKACLYFISLWKATNELELYIKAFFYACQAQAEKEAVDILTDLLPKLERLNKLSQIDYIVTELEKNFGDLNKFSNKGFNLNRAISIYYYSQGVNYPVIKQLQLWNLEKLSHKSHEDKEHEAQTIFTIGCIEQHLIDYENSFKNLVKALNISRKNFYNDTQFRSLQYLGRLCEQLELFSEALLFYTAALAPLGKENADIIKEGIILYNQARQYAKLEDFTKAREAYEQSYKVAKNNDDKRYQLFSTVGLIELDLLLSKDYSGISNIGSLLEVSKKARDKHVECVTLICVGKCYQKERNYIQAFENFNACLEYAKKQKHYEHVLAANKALESLYLNQDMKNEAKGYLIEAEKIRCRMLESGKNIKSQLITLAKEVNNQIILKESSK
ncbi:NB-ARC domain-containing protein [Nodosilinea sp. E11]|uniref:NB-ARC domain-containing protein n=1 Tax=Nodosilinea sp. E11 TaxID=3037479 RepID=UPI0029349047|nr:NB-ARC domain-containing protein [Nodosilinea sp. E11]WOD37325.1 NB-ARC domain-containing protein [Nodosilinea sp. E11]